MNDDLYVDVHKEMERTGDSFSAVIVRRLNKLKEIEDKNV
jgi:predicted CopG family antitoxin